MRFLLPNKSSRNKSYRFMSLAFVVLSLVAVSFSMSLAESDESNEEDERFKSHKSSNVSRPYAQVKSDSMDAREDETGTESEASIFAISEAFKSSKDDLNAESLQDSISSPYLKTSTTRPYISSFKHYKLGTPNQSLEAFRKVVDPSLMYEANPLGGSLGFQDGFTWIFVTVENPVVEEELSEHPYFLMFRERSHVDFEVFRVDGDPIAGKVLASKKIKPKDRIELHNLIEIPRQKGTYHYWVKYNWTYQERVYAGIKSFAEVNHFVHGVQIINGVYLGMILVLVAFQYFFFAGFKNLSLVGYIGYLLSMAMVVIIGNGLGSSLFGGYLGDVLLRNYHLVFIFPPIFALLFSYDFLEMKRLPFMKIVYAGLFSYIIYMGGGLIVSGKAFLGHHEAAASSAFGLILISALVATHLRLRVRLVYALGWILFGLSYMVWRNIDDPETIKSIYFAVLPIIGSGLEIGCMTLSMSYYFNSVKSKAQESDSNRKIFILLQRLLRIIIHDIANPLSIASGNAIMALRRNVSSEKDARIKKVQRALKKIEQILQTVGKFKNISSQSVEIELEKVYIEDVFMEADFLFSEKAQSKGIDLNFSEVDDTSYVMAEFGSFSNEVINNILSNAIKFSDSGSQIQLNYMETGDKKIIEIRDQGTGMDNRKIEQLLSDEDVESLSGTRGEQGTGYGVQIMRQFMELYGAQVEIESKRRTSRVSAMTQRGTTFRLIFNRDDACEADIKKISPLNAEGSPRSLKNQNPLLADSVSSKRGKSSEKIDDKSSSKKESA